MRLRRQRYFDQQDGLCYYCDQPMRLIHPEEGETAPDDMATLEHIVPKIELPKFGFPHHPPPPNVVLACWKCNIRKGCRLPEGWDQRMGDWLYLHRRTWKYSPIRSAEGVAVAV